MGKKKDLIEAFRVARDYILAPHKPSIETASAVDEHIAQIEAIAANNIAKQRYGAPINTAIE